jgi:hypothetical protein
MSHRRALIVAGLMTLAPHVAIAQPASTAEGIAAFVRGDYARAVEILRPAAERWHLPHDNIAAFFMAMIYENGLGVAPDPVRACALLLRTAVPVGDGPRPGRALTFAAQALAEDSNSRLTPDQMGRCMSYVDVGFHNDFQPVTFSLAPGHWIRLEDSWPEQRGVSARIEYDGKETRVELSVPQRTGSRLLPLTVTELTSLRPRPEPRHFLEAFLLVPSQVNRWTLMWFVLEIVRNTLVEVTIEEVRTFEGDHPPSLDVADLRRLATVRVNADGDAEWVVLSGADQRGDVIETDAERQELAAEKRARDAAEQKVDWSLRRPIERAPSFAYAASGTCYGSLAYGWSTDRTEAITLRLGPAAFQGGSSGSTFVIGQSLGFEAVAQVFDRPRRDWPFCSDVHAVGDEGEQWGAVAGTIAVELSPVFRVREPESYRATIRLTGAEFVSATGARVRQSQPITLSTTVRVPQY